MHDLLADLPAPRDDEPSSLRQDILDELSDHLSCAYHRELVKSGSEDTAQARVLDRFGNPRRIACQLWFQAMWSRIMLQRVSLGLQVLLTIGVLVVAFLLFRVLDFQFRIHDEWQAIKTQSSSNQAMLVQLLQRIPAPAGGDASGRASGMEAMAESGGMMAADMGAGSAAPGGSPMGSDMMMPGMDATQSQPRPAPNLLVRVVTARDEKIPAQNYHIEVRNENGEGIPGESVQGASYGAEMSGTYSGMPGLGMYGGSNGSTFSGDGRFIRQWVPGPRPQPVSYSEVPPGRYTAIVEFPDGRVGRQRFAVLPKQTRTVTVVCPEPLEPSLVTLVGPKQESVDPAYEIRVGVSIRRKDEKLGQTDWSVKEETAWDVWFDPKTGLATTLQTPIEPKGRRGSAQMITFDEDDPADTRFVSLKSGPYELTWKFLLVWQDKSKAGLDLSNPANMPPIESPKELHTAQAGSTTWTLTVPEALWSEVKKRAQGFSPRESGLPRSGQSNLVQIQWTTPAGLRLISRSGENDFEVLPAVPGRWHLQSGRAYELALTGIPDHPEETWNLDLELPELADHWRNFLAQNAIPFTLTDDDIEAVLNRQVLVKVAYLKGPPEDGNAAPVVETIVSTRLDPSADPVEEANKRGTVLAVWKISAPATTKPTDASNPANHD